MQRIVYHIDLDAFYASVEELRNPAIKGAAIVVCAYSGRSRSSGAVATANYKARELGIKAGMPVVYAQSLAKNKDVVFLPADKEYYGIVSERVMDLLESFADVMEQASIDEAYLDVSKKTGGDFKLAEDLAREIKATLKKEENLTCSIGVGPNKFIAKMASRKQKPDGLTIVKPDEVIDFLKDLPVSKLHGVGDKTVEQLSGLGIKTAGDLAGFELEKLVKVFGRNKAVLLKNKSLGVDDSPVLPKEKQQISNMMSLRHDSSNLREVLQAIFEVSRTVNKRIKNMDATFKTVSVILIDSRFKMYTRSRTIDEEKEVGDVFPVIEALVTRFFEENPGKAIRRVGVAVSGLNYGKEKIGRQKTLLDY